MGRRFLASAVIAAAMSGVATGPALAKSVGPTLSNGLKLTARQHVLLDARNQAVGPHIAGSAVVLNHGRNSECTVPERGGAYANFFTHDTTNYFEADTVVSGEGLLVGSCTANLNNPQTSATSQDRPGDTKLIATPGKYATYSEACTIPYEGLSFLGDAESIVYKDNQFVEICIAPAYTVG